MTGRFVSPEGLIVRAKTTDKSAFETQSVENLFEGVRFGSQAHIAILDTVQHVELLDSVMKARSSGQPNIAAEVLLGMNSQTYEYKRLINNTPEDAATYSVAAATMDAFFTEALVQQDTSKRIAEVKSFLENLRDHQI